MFQPSQTHTPNPDADPADAADAAGVARPTLCVERLTFGYRPDRPVISPTDAQLHAGRLTVLLGPNATGKTTLLRLMLGQLTPDAGRVLLDGRDLADTGASEQAGRLSYVAQQSPTAFAFTVEQVVAMGRYAQPDDGGAAVARALCDCDLDRIVAESYNELSGGQQQRVSVARALAQSGWGQPGDGRAVLLDEPVASADLRHAHETMALLKRAAHDGRAVLVVLHDLNLAATWADDVWLMDGGELVFAGPWHQALRAERLDPIYNMTLTALHHGDNDRPIFHAAVPGDPPAHP